MELKFAKLSNTMSVNIDNHQDPSYACYRCGALIFDKLKHAEFHAKVENIQDEVKVIVVNGDTDDMRFREGKASLMKKAKIIRTQG